jgi:hypothetical protein
MGVFKAAGNLRKPFALGDWRSDAFEPSSSSLFSAIAIDDPSLRVQSYERGLRRRKRLRK